MWVLYWVVITLTCSHVNLLCVVVIAQVMQSCIHTDHIQVQWWVYSSQLAAVTCEINSKCDGW